MPSLWMQNTPEKFWMCQPPIPEECWQAAIKKSIPSLNFENDIKDLEDLLNLTLGEGRFGPNHWSLSFSKKLYYLIKPILPRSFTRILRRLYSRSFDKSELKLSWPVDPRYARFQWEVLRQALVAANKESIGFKSLWPKSFQFAFTLTHDIETREGQIFVGRVADLEESLGFKSSFNFVLERYPLDHGLIRDLKGRGFEVGCHGLKHDGKLFSTKKEFAKRAAKINAYMKEYDMVGFRSPLTHRNPEWMQALEIEYDLSFFDTDPFEPIPGGAMSIWPFFMGSFVELPYTLVQDYTLTSVLGEPSPRVWLDKVAFIEKYHGMALVNSHPDYLKDRNNWNIYRGFLEAMKNRNGYWHALPRDLARWWRFRAEENSNSSGDAIRLNQAQLVDGQIVLNP